MSLLVIFANIAHVLKTLFFLDLGSRADSQVSPAVRRNIFGLLIPTEYIYIFFTIPLLHHHCGLAILSVYFLTIKNDAMMEGKKSRNCSSSLESSLR